jgi:hypothetical protein
MVWFKGSHTRHLIVGRNFMIGIKGEAPKCSISMAERQSMQIEYAAKGADERVIRLLTLLERGERQMLSRAVHAIQMESRLMRKPGIVERKDPKCVKP